MAEPIKLLCFAKKELECNGIDTLPDSWTQQQTIKRALPGIRRTRTVVKDMEILQALENKNSVLVLVSGTGYGEMVLDTVKKLSHKRVCYVTLNKKYDSLVEHFKKNNVHVKNIAFVDAISPTMQQMPAATDQCVYVSSPEALTELSIAITQLLKLKFDYVVFDSLTSLLLYEQKAQVPRFVSGLVNKAGAANTQAILYALDSPEHSLILKECGMYVDHILELGKKE